MVGIFDPVMIIPLAVITLVSIVLRLAGYKYHIESQNYEPRFAVFFPIVFLSAVAGFIIGFNNKYNGEKGGFLYGVMGILIFIVFGIIGGIIGGIIAALINMRRKEQDDLIADEEWKLKSWENVQKKEINPEIWEKKADELEENNFALIEEIAECNLKGLMHLWNGAEEPPDFTLRNDKRRIGNYTLEKHGQSNLNDWNEVMALADAVSACILDMINEKYRSVQFNAKSYPVAAYFKDVTLSSGEIVKTGNINEIVTQFKKS